MSLVTLGDKAKALAMLVPGISSKQETMLRSLAGKTTWTNRQRELVETMWNERQQKNKEAMMQKKAVLCVGLAMTVALMAGCAATYEKRYTDHDGKPVVITEQHEPDWWNNLGTPDWMNVRHETITRDGKVVVDRHCTHKPTTPTVLDCVAARD
mgnify:CR=1 FL=1